VLAKRYAPEGGTTTPCKRRTISILAASPFILRSAAVAVLTVGDSSLPFGAIPSARHGDGLLWRASHVSSSARTGEPRSQGSHKRARITPDRPSRTPRALARKRHLSWTDARARPSMDDQCRASIAVPAPTTNHSIRVRVTVTATRRRSRATAGPASTPEPGAVSSPLPRLARSPSR
jgi:hypothetical protein